MAAMPSSACAEYGAGASVELADFAYGTGVFGLSFNAATGVLTLTNSASPDSGSGVPEVHPAAGTFHLAKDTGTGVLLTRA